MKGNQVDIFNLQTIKNYALRQGVTPSYIYKRIKEQKMAVVTIDGVQFINTKDFPTFKGKG